MSVAKTRLSSLLGHFKQPLDANGTAAPAPVNTPDHGVNFHTLSPTFFLPRAAAIEPDVSDALLLPGQLYIFGIENRLNSLTRNTGGSYLPHHRE
jgi:hypothetical protein